MNTEVRTAAYRTGRRTKAVDIHTPLAGPSAGLCVLLWHGTGPDERDVLAPLAGEIAAFGHTVLVPDWQSDQPDQGRVQLTDSLRFALDHSRARCDAPRRLVVGGWSAGAGAALGAAMRPELFGDWQPAAVIGIAGDFHRPARTIGIAPVDALTRDTPRVPVRLIHGTEDTVVPSDSSRAMHQALLDRGWDAGLTELATDHAGLLGCAYDPTARRCLPAQSAPARDARRATATTVAAVARALAAG